MEGCEKPFRVAPPGGDDMVMLIADVDISTLAGFPCAGSEIGGADLDLIIDGGVVDGCDGGWKLNGRNAAQLITGGHYVTNAVDRAVQASGNPGSGNGATVMIRDSVVQSNGGGNGSAPRGGVTVDKKGRLDLGTSTDAGGNKICRNQDGNSSDRDVHINRTDINVDGYGNYWRFDGGAPVVVKAVPEGTEVEATFDDGGSSNRLKDEDDPLPGIGISCQ